jgi:arylsulfatase A-like enzyme
MSVLVACSGPQPSADDPSTATTRPNIIIILTDDQRAGLSVMPATRRFFGGGGTRYTRGFANTPLCCPARATLMSGQYSHNNGVTGNHSWKALDQQDTLQADLSADGYRTAIFGKYLNLFPVADRDPPYFDRFAVFHSGGGSDYYRNGTWNIDGSVTDEVGYSTTLIRRRGVSFIRNNTDRPWFMILSVPAAHMPRTPEPKYADARFGGWDGNPAVRERDRSDKPPWVRSMDLSLDRARVVRREQFRTLLSVDDLVGEVASAIRDTGQSRRTLAFYVTDNSYAWGEHGMFGKPSPYMPGLKMPFYARWPGRLEAGAADGRLVAQADITATIYDAAGIAPEHTLDGRSLLGSEKRDRLLLETLSVSKKIPQWRALVTAAGFHYTQYYSDSGKLIYRELYDLRDDPWELRNLTANGPTVRSKRLATILRNVKDCAGTSCP